MAIIGGALIGGAALSAGGGIFSSIFGASAQSKGLREAGRLAQETAYELDRRQAARTEPFRQFGLKAGDTLLGMLTGSSDVSNVLQESPLFQFQSELGQRDITRALAARGLNRSGAGLETLQRFSNQLVAEEGQRFYDRLFNLTSLGANAASNQATNTSSIGQNLMGIQGNLGVAQAGAQGQLYQGVGNVIAGAGNTLAQLPINYGIVNRLNQFNTGGTLNLPAVPNSSSLMNFAPSMQAQRLGLTGV